MQETTSSPILHRAVRNSILIGLGTVATFVLGFVFGGLTIRYLGESRAGYLLTLQTILALNALLGGFGLGTPSIRRIAVLHAQADLPTARAVVGSVSTVNIITGLLFALLIVILFPAIFTWSRLDPVYQIDAFWATFFVVASFLFAHIRGPWQAVYHATQRYDLITALTTIFGLLSGATGIAVLTVAPYMSTIALSNCAVSAVLLMCDTFFVRRLLGRIPIPTWKWSEIRPMLGFGGWTYLSSLGGFLFTNLDRLILTAFLGSAAMPYYVMPQRLFLQIHTALGSQCQFLFPMLSAFGDTAAVQIERLKDRLRWFVALTSGAAYTGLALVGLAILSRLVSPEFAELATLPLFLACIQGFVHAQMIVPYFTSWTVGAGAPNTVAQLTNGVLVVLTAIWLIPRYGFVGASVAQLWIGPVVLVHTLWVRRLLSPQGDLWGWLRAYISPCLMIGAWLLVVQIGRRFVAPYSIMFYILVLAGGLVGLALVWLVERVAFAAEGRWATLMRAIEIPLNRIRSMVLVR